MEELHKEQIISIKSQYEATIVSLKKEFSKEMSEVKYSYEEKLQNLKDQLKVGKFLENLIYIFVFQKNNKKNRKAKMIVKKS